MGSALDALLGLGVQFNLTQSVQTAIFERLKDLMIPDLMSFAQAQRHAEERSHVTVKELPVCPNECEIFGECFKSMTKEERETSACKTCAARFISLTEVGEIKHFRPHKVCMHFMQFHEISRFSINFCRLMMLFVLFCCLLSLVGVLLPRCR